MNRLGRLAAVLLVTLCLTGCWSLLEVDRRSLATTIGIDGARKKVTVTLHIPEPQKLLPPVTSGSGQGRNFEVVSISAGSVNEAVEILQTKTFRELVLQQNKSIIIGERTAREGVADLLDYLQRNPRAPSQALVFVADGSTAKEVLSFTPSEQTLPGIQFFTMGQTAVKYGRTQLIPLWLFQQKLYHPTKDPYAALVRMDEKQGTYVVSGIAAFSGDRMAGKLNATETLSLSLMTNLVKAGSISFQNIDGTARLSLSDVKSRTRFHVRHTGSLPHFTVDVRVTGSVSEMVKRQELNPRFIRRLEKGMERSLCRRCVAVITKLQGFNSDIVDFGEQLRIQDPPLWGRINWKRTFPKVPFQVNVRVRIMGDGTLR